MPETLPDLSKHNSYFSDAMKSNDKLYASLKDMKTSKGVTLGHCIKTGIDNPGALSLFDNKLNWSDDSFDNIFEFNIFIMRYSLYQGLA